MGVGETGSAPSASFSGSSKREQPENAKMKSKNIIKNIIKNGTRCLRGKINQTFREGNLGAMMSPDKSIDAKQKYYSV
jgi:hypothetical protein